MEAAVEVTFPAEVAVARLMGSPEGFGSSGGKSGCAVVGEVRWPTEGACSPGGRRVPAFWRKIPDSEICMEASQSSSLRSNDSLNECGFGNMNLRHQALNLDVKPVLQKSGKIVRNNSGCSKRPGKVQREVSKGESGLHDVNCFFPELASSSASCNISVVEKNQLVKQKSSSTSRRGDKRNTKVKSKNRCDSFSLKNGLVGFNSAAGGNDFFGMYGLKPNDFDITKHVDELSLEELLSGSYSCPSMSKDKGKKAASSNSNLMQSVRNACSVLQAQKVLMAQSSAEIDNSCIRKVSTGLVTISSAGQSDGDNGDICNTNTPSSDKVQESDDKISISKIADSRLYKPKDILERLALPPPKDLDLLLCDGSKANTSSKSSSDPRLGKPVTHRTGLPPFPWSHSFSGHSKLGSDAVKLSTSRAICQGRWVRVKNSTAPQKGSADLLVDFESLTFDHNLIPSTNLMTEHPANEFAPIERVLAASGACSTSKTPPDEYSPTHAAAETLLNMAAHSKENPCAMAKLLKKHSQTTMKVSKFKPIQRLDKSFDTPKSTTRPTNPLKVGDDGYPSKKLRLSTDTPNASINHIESVRKGTIHMSASLPFKSPPKKLFRDPTANTDSYNGINLVKKPYMMKSPRGAERPGSNKQKFWKSPQ